LADEDDVSLLPLIAKNIKEEEQMKTVVLDLETIPDESWTPPVDEPDKFSPIPHHIPVVISYMVNGKLEEPYVRSADANAEKVFLEVLGAALSTADRIVTWNGRGFDMPLLNLRAMLHHADWKFWPGKRHRFGNYKQDLVHYDMMDLIADQGYVKMKLDDVCRLLGIPGKDDIDGSQVKRVWAEEGGPQRVTQYCEQDVVRTYLVYLRYVETMTNAPSDKARQLTEAVAKMAGERFGGEWAK
jgi:predicted PolB exonuclease-like 3'-5' exonuclease